MKLKLGFSPCPNDTFIFDALIHNKIDTEGLEFEVVYEDVETLNQMAFDSQLDITKLSYHAFGHLIENYILLDSGSALGFGVGPLLICDNEEFISPQFDLRSRVKDLRIGIPGNLTTANMLLGLALPEAENRVIMNFTEIEKALLNKHIDLGVIIHENRFTYQDKGLLKIMDLGEYWEGISGGAIPLGGIVIKRELDRKIQLSVNRILERSVRFAFRNPTSGLEFIKSHAQEMSNEVIYKHIELYVNKYSLNLGEEGKKAVRLFLNEALKQGIIPESHQEIFLSN